MQSPNIRDIRVSVSIDDLLGPLGYNDSDAVEKHVMDQIVSETMCCQQLLEGRMIYTRLEVSHSADVKGVTIKGMPIDDPTLVDSLDGARSLAVAVCTIGSRMDRLIKEYFGCGDYLRGMIADVIGNRAVEDVANKCATLICGEARDLNLSTANRQSPGYGKWDVSGQKIVFGLLDPTPIDVSLNEHCMMQPQKSISFVIPLVEGEVPTDERPLCHGCSFQNCSYRRT